MELRFPLGIGDVLLAAAYYHSYYKDKMDRPTLVFNLSIIQQFRNGSTAYEIFIRRLITDLFPEEKILFVSDRNPVTHPDRLLPRSASYSLTSRLSLPPLPDFDFESSYTVLLTKIRIDGTRDYIYQNLDRIVAGLNEIPGQLVILGERKIASNLETQVHDVISIYNRLNHPRSLDLTQETLTNDPDYNMFLRDLSILHHAKRVIGIGFGGNFVMSLAFAREIVFLNTPGNEYAYFFHLDIPGMYIVDNIETFLSLIKEIDWKINS